MNFFQLSKLFELVFEPGNLLVLLLCVGLILQATRCRRLGLWLSLLSALVFLLVIFLPFNQWAMRPLEDRFARPSSLTHVDGILVLGGGQEQMITATRAIPTQDFGEGILVETVALMRLYPKARVIFSGGSGIPVGSGPSEANVARQIFDQLGADQSRITYEDRSRNSWENFLFSQKLVRPKPRDEWLLVTFALHMPRSMGIARKLGWPMTAWPVDYQTRGDGNNAAPWSLSGNLSQLESALHEWIGLVVYRWTGKTDALFPRP